MTLALVILSTILLGSLWCSMFEWTLHKYVMHRPVHFIGIRLHYPFRKHALTHHHTFTGTESYHIHDEADKKVIKMAWWAGPILVLLMEILPASVALGFLLSGYSLIGWTIATIGIVVAAAYFFAYEYLHWCMHFPKDRWIERTKALRFLNGHHALHHHFQDNNLNVVFPFADMIFGTLMLRAPQPYPQPKPPVPDLQPH